MKLKALPGDFQVEERAQLRLTPAGRWAVYRVRKVGLSTLEVQTRLAAMLNLSREQVVFPALKDKEAITIQFASLPAGLAETMEGEHFRAQRVGLTAQPLGPADLRGNAFTVVARDLAPAEAEHLAARLRQLAQVGLPNYFDAQRFGSYAGEGGWIGRAILQRDAEGALRAYLTQSFRGDPAPVRAFKRQAVGLWGEWPAMFAAAPRPSNYRSVLTFLVGHPQDYRKALNLIPQRLLALYLAAYQSYLWNHIAAAYLGGLYRHLGVAVGAMEIIGEALPTHADLPIATQADLRGATLALPDHRASYPSGALGEAAQGVLAAEGLAQEDLKARILQKAYLPRGRRSLLVWPEEVAVAAPVPDERFPGRLALTVRFALPAGSYATLVMQAAGGKDEG
jgi:tRNA pseudouridine13 synthase